VAFARGVATNEASLSRACSDPLAHRLLPYALGLLVRASGRSRVAARMLRYSSMGMFDHHALRTGIIDRAVLEAIRRGARQLVLLGAGLDTRAYRMPELSDVVVFEVDHASTQAYKRRRAQGLVSGAREIRYAACDFEHTSIDVALAGAGFDRTVPACVIWEGVTVFLPESAIEDTLTKLSTLCAGQSTLVATYASPPERARPSTSWTRSASILKAIAEPIRFTCSPEAMAARLLKHGFRVTADAQPFGQRLEFGIAPLPFRAASLAQVERVVVAERTGRPS
jgi:methyltransferase (TIGR00027 family)